MTAAIIHSKSFKAAQYWNRIRSLRPDRIAFMTREPPCIDFTKIDFPSDKLTIKMFRQAWPKSVDVDVDEKFSFNVSEHRPYRRDRLDEDLGASLLDTEREIAERAFRIALGQDLKNPPRDPSKQYIHGEPSLVDRDWLIECLSDVYVRGGLAAGKHEALALIERIEVQAVAQARQFASPHR